MKFKVGDKVRVRQWKAMKREYGLEDNGFSRYIPVKNIRFTDKMRDFCGKVVTIEKENRALGTYHVKEDDCCFAWTDDMFEGYAFEYGDKIEVSDDGERWEKGFYVGYLDGFHLPYACATGGDKEAFAEGKKFHALFWKYARPIQKHTIIIDGKEIEISEESYKKLKESLLK